MQTPDTDLEHAVVTALQRQTGSDIADISVSVTDGVVTLAGTVSSWRSRIVADAVTRQVPGVLEVHNNVLFSGIIGTDRGLRHSARDVLDRTFPLSDSARIDAAVSMGWVTLTGQLDCWTRRTQAERVIASLPGVCGIFNCIAVRPVLQPASAALLEVSTCNQKESGT